MAGFQSIQKRLALFVALGSLVIATVVGLLAFSFEYRDQHRQARQLQDQLVATVIASAAVGAFAGNNEIAKEVTEGLLVNPIIASVEIESLNGFHQGRSRLPDGAAGELVVYPLLSPVDNVERIGDLKVRQDVGEINRRAVDDALAYAGLLILQIAISAGLLMLLFGRVVGRPLTQVAKMLELVPPGSSQRIAVPAGHDNNEIGMLVHSSNTLLSSVEVAILEERRLQAEVNEMQVHYRRIFETTDVGIMILRPSGALLNGNSTLMSRMVGITFDATSAERGRDFIETIFCMPDKAWAMVWEARDTRQAVANDLQLRGEDGHERWAHCIISVKLDAGGVIEMIEGVLYDVTARRLRESEALQAAEVDQLTDLTNRRGMELFLDQAIRRAASSEGSRFGVMLLDLDGFKAINDTYGHAAGDTVLKVVSQRISARMRRSLDMVARLGGDEFTVIVSDTHRHPGLLEQIANDLLHLVSQPINLEGEIPVKVGTSMGIASFPGDGLSSKSLLDAADAAMYAAKRGGKNGFVLASTLKRPMGS
jgi:diguanylate cyclase (GGDEF)-like protein/PAS domain S-box-containing protein